MTDGGKPGTGKARRKRTAPAAAAKPSPAEKAAPKPEAAGPAPVVDEAAAPVGFSARDTSGDAVGDRSAAAKPGSGARVAVLLTAAVAVVAVAGYLTRGVWLPGAGKPSQPAKTADVAKPAAKPVTQSTDASADKPAAPAAAQLDALTKEREQLRAELDRLIARLDGVEKSMDMAKQMIRATAPPEEKIAGGPSLAQLSDRVGALEKSEAALKDLMKRVDKMEKDATAGGGGEGARAVVLAVSGLGDALARGEPYQRHLEALKAVAGGDPNVKAAVALLAKHAEAGIPTLTALRDRFDKLAGRIVRAAKVADDGGWMARAADSVASLITLRRVGDEAKGATVDAVVARAERHLKSGDLAAAVKAVDDLAEVNKKAAAVAEPWLADARARVTGERALASLHVHAVTLLAPAR